MLFKLPFGRPKKAADFFVLGGARLEMLQQEGRYSCYRNTRATLHKLARFTGRHSLPVKEVTKSLLEGFRDYLTDILGNSHNTVVENFKVISQLLDEAGVAQNPCKVLKLTRETTERCFLQEDELQRILSLRLKAGSEIDMARDIFYVECRTGLRISDLLNLRWGSVSNGMLHLKMQKTRRRVTIPISAGVGAVLDKYRTLFDIPSMRVFPIVDRFETHDRSFESDRARVYATARINLQLKKLAKRAGIKKNVSTHTGRHTFATALIGKGASIYEVKELLGHHDVRVTQVYAHLLDSRKRELVECLDSGSRPE